MTIGGDGNVGDEVVVASKSTAGISVVALLTSEVPDDDGLTKGKRDEKVNLILFYFHSSNKNKTKQEKFQI